MASSSPWRQDPFYWAVLLPIGLLLAFWVWPLLGALLVSMADFTHDMHAPRFVGLANYARLLGDPNTWALLGRTLLFCATVAPAMTIGGILLGLLCGEARPGMGLARGMLYVPVVTSFVVTALLWKGLLIEDGLINHTLSLFAGLIGLPAVKIPWLATPTTAMVGVTLAVVWKGLGYYAMFAVAQFQQRNKNLDEAALLDGASRWDLLWRITLPQLRPAVFLILLISTVGALKTFTEIYVMTNGGPVNATETLAVAMLQRGFGELDLGGACVLGFVLMGLVIVLSAAQQWLQHQGQQQQR
jgi:ABC-type sugar transport system permease subunit